MDEDVRKTLRDQMLEDLAIIRGHTESAAESISDDEMHQLIKVVGRIKSRSSRILTAASVLSMSDRGKA